jgi:hypothetical protein
MSIRRLWPIWIACTSRAACRPCAVAQQPRNGQRPTLLCAALHFMWAPSPYQLYYTRLHGVRLARLFNVDW